MKSVGKAILLSMQIIMLVSCNTFKPQPTEKSTPQNTNLPILSSTPESTNTPTNDDKKSASKETAEKVTLEFITALHSNQIAAAHEMISEKIRDNISINDVKTLSEDPAIKAFESLNVCEIKIASSKFGEQLIGFGILRFSDGELIFYSSLLQDSDGKWYTAGFYFEPDLTATPSNVCKIEQSQTSSVTATPTVPTAHIDFPLNAKIGSIVVSPKDNMKLVFVPAGEFLMGSETGKENEKPVHSVYLDSFWIDQTEVTNSMYLLCVKDGVCQKPLKTILYDDPDFADSPVNYITWENANAYCGWAGRRLPTEAEWEKAASWDDTNKKKRVYPWGDTIDCSFANIYGLGDNCQGYPVKVGSYPLGASYYGAFDMAGNVLEWVADWYDDWSIEAYYKISPYSNPKGPTEGKYHVLRGSSFLFDASNTTRQVEDFFDDWQTFYDSVGFRCAINSHE
jgi:formylglycine-generating enzyme required for sulfatase activity